MNNVDLSTLDDETLWRRTMSLAAAERGSTADLIEHLAEVDDRELWIKKGYCSMFEYCVYGLRFSDGAAFKRIRAARSARILRPILGMLRDGRLSLAAVAALHPYLKDAAAASLVEKAAGLRIRKLEALLADRQVSERVRDVIRFVGAEPPPPKRDEAQAPLFDSIDPVAARAPASVPPSAIPGAPKPAVIIRRPVRFAFTADESFYKMLERARALLRHKYPDGRLEGVLGDALKALLERKDPGARWVIAKARRASAASESVG